LESLRSFAGLGFKDCPDEWDAPFKPTGGSEYFFWPLLTDLMPWQHSGVQAKRTWPIGATVEVLRERWRQLLAASDRSTALKETRDRKTTSRVDALFAPSAEELTSIARLDRDAQPETIVRYGYRSFDRHYLIADNRIADYLRPDLWHTVSASQLFFASQFSQPLGSGPALTTCAEVPDLDFFRGSYGAKNIFPFYRDAEAKYANLHPELLSILAAYHGQPVSPEDFAAYLYGILAQPAFTERFHGELASRELRLPLTRDAALFQSVAVIGRELLYLHTYGERFAADQTWPPPTVKCLKAVPAGQLPENFNYDGVARVIRVDSGEFGPVDVGVWEYEVSGLKVVQSWLGYRMRNRKGKKSSPLDDITPTGWNSDYTSEFLRLLNLLTRTLALHPRQAELLDDILCGSLFDADELPPVPPQWRKAPTTHAAQGSLDV
ncbi:MAG: hypothetical protein LBJ59_00785, partial [Zoogloeaceae bacterium]|jgi:predicted helicase|nr:hypothetical protein [Zoogloeaceae bacterium]